MGLPGLPRFTSAFQGFRHHLRRHGWETLLLLTGVACVGLSVAWTPLSAESSASSTSQAVKTPIYLRDTDLIRVGIVRSGFDNLSYDDMAIEGTEGLRLYQGSFLSEQNRLQAPLLALPAGVRLSLKRERDVSTGQPVFRLRWAAERNSGQLPQEMSVPDTFWVEPTSVSGRLMLPSIQRRGKIPSYRGVFQMTPDPKTPEHFTAVNMLPLKDYLKAVVPNELPLSFGLEAVKAQAVLARNYAINPREKPWTHFDICDTEYCQAYYGAGSEDPKVTQLLEQTEGQVALYRGEPILALYSSTHGGVSENHENVFPNPNSPASANLPYLKGRSDYPLDKDLSVEANARWFYTANPAPKSFDVNSPLYRWSRSWTGPEYAAMLAKNLKSITKNTFNSSSIQCFDTRSNALSDLDFGELLSVKPEKRGVSGKILSLGLRSSNLACTVNKEYTIRKLFESSGKALPSANFVLTEEKDASGKVTRVVAHGGGFGHGVGMSQYGAGWMAQHGYRYGDIIRHYYKDTLLGTIPLVLKSAVPNRLDFVAPSTRAQLVLQSPSSVSNVHIRLNGQELPAFNPRQSPSVMDVSSYLKPNRINVLEATSGAKDSGKLWLEF
jgi:SpoIID/LytB domain protein